MQNNASVTRRYHQPGGGIDGGRGANRGGQKESLKNEISLHGSGSKSSENGPSIPFKNVHSIEIGIIETGREAGRAKSTAAEINRMKSSAFEPCEKYLEST
jgi:hypothetical protein